MVEIMIVVSIIGMFLAIAVPNFVRARNISQMDACFNNLRQLDSALQQWALETKQNGVATPGVTDIDPYLGRAGSTANVICPSGGAAGSFGASYTIGAVNVSPLCKIVAATHVLP